MKFFKLNSFNKKLIFVTLVVLIFGSSIRLIQTNIYGHFRNSEEVRGVFVENTDNVTYKPLKEENIVEIGYISLEKYDEILKEREIQEKYIDTDENFATKEENVRKYMAGRGTPLAEKAKYLVTMANKFEIDYRLVPAISIIESSGGIHLYRPFNAWGWGGANGITFESWEHSIYVVTSGIAKGYYARGATTPRQIAPAYNPHTPDEWGAKVELTMNQIGEAF